MILLHEMRCHQILLNHYSKSWKCHHLSDPKLYICISLTLDFHNLWLHFFHAVSSFSMLYVIFVSSKNIYFWNWNSCNVLFRIVVIVYCCSFVTRENAHDMFVHLLRQHHHRSKHLELVHLFHHTENCMHCLEITQITMQLLSVVIGDSHLGLGQCRARFNHLMPIILIVEVVYDQVQLA